MYYHDCFHNVISYDKSFLEPEIHTLNSIYEGCHGNLKKDLLWCYQIFDLFQRAQFLKRAQFFIYDLLTFN